MVSSSLRELLAEKEKISRNDFIVLLEANSKYAFTNYLPWADLSQSYNTIRHDGIAIGESYFATGYDGLLAPSGYTYTISVIIDDTIVRISLMFGDNQAFDMAKQLSNYFVKRGNYFYWIDRNAIGLFYQQLSTDDYRHLPQSLQKLREGFDLIIHTLEIKNAELPNPMADYVLTHITTDNLRLRAEATTASSSLITLPKGTNIQILETGRTETIDGITAPWVRVRSSTGYQGWCFSGYLRKLSMKYDDSIKKMPQLWHDLDTKQTKMKRFILALDYADEIKQVYTTCGAAQ
jgi:hypothetical protein